MNRCLEDGQPVSVRDPSSRRLCLCASRSLHSHAAAVGLQSSGNCHASAASDTSDDVESTSSAPSPMCSPSPSSTTCSPSPSGSELLSDSQRAQLVSGQSVNTGDRDDEAAHRRLRAIRQHQCSNFLPRGDCFTALSRRPSAIRGFE